MDLHVYIHAGDQDQLAAITRRLSCLEKQGETIMATLQQIADDMTAETTLIASIGTLITGLEAQVAAALAGTTIPPAVQAQIDAIFTQAEGNKAALAGAAAAGTPPTPQPPVVAIKTV